MLLPKTLKIAGVLSAIALTASAQTPILIGSGSYASAPPAYKSKTDAHDGCRAMAVETSRLWVDHDGERPIPTNDWWTDLINNQFADALWSLPAMVHPSEQGATVNYPKHWSDNGTELQWKSGVTLGAASYSAASAIAADWSDWMLVMRMPSLTDASKQIRVTMLHGSPITWAEYEGDLTPSLTFPATPEFFGAKKGRIGVAIGDDLYGVYFADNGSTRMRADALEIEGTRYVAVALLRSRDDLDTFAEYALTVPRKTTLSWEFNEATSTLSTHWHTDAVNLKDGKSASTLLQGFLPHAVKSALSAPAGIGGTYQTPRGKMRLCAGNDFTFTYRFTGILPYFAMPGEEAQQGEHPYRPEVMKTLVENYADKGTFGDDTYWGGKGLVQMGINMMIARDNGMEEAFEKSRKALRNALEDWLTYEAGEEKRFFAYYPRWRSLVGFNVSYDSDAFNDHHFHYGYFVYSGALLCMADPDFAEKYGEMLKLLVKDYANYDRDDSRFPFLRTMDPWVGHSYAGGLGDHVNSNGNGQESSSEAMQSWGGVYMLGVALGDKQLRDAGIMGWLTESNATGEYWFDRDHIYPDREGNYDYTKYKSPWNTNITCKGIGWWTWFSGDPIWMHSIQWMPVSPCLNYLSRDLNFAKWDYEQMINSTERKWFESTGTPDANGNLPDGPLANESLGNVVLCYLERSDPEQAAGIFDKSWEQNMGMARGIDTGHISYYTIHSHRTYGEIDWDVWADTPSATAYRRADGTMTYVVYNAPGSEQQRTVNFYRNGAVERSVNIRAGEGMVAFSAPAAPSSVKLTSKEGNVVAPGASTQLEAAVLDQYGATTGEAVTLALTSGAATLSGNTLKINANAAKGSKVTVTATGAGKTALLEIEVNNKPVVTAISLTPTPAYMLSGSSVDFKATVKDQYGKEMECPVTFSSNVKGGRFTAKDAGKVTVTATAGDVTASHTLVVLPELPDLALHKNVEVSSYENAGSLPSGATDGDDTTRWGSQHTDNEWIYVDLGSECSIVNIDIKWEAAFASAYDIDFSNDAQNWQTVSKVTGVSGPGWVSTPVDGRARYVRIYGRQRGSQYGYSLYTLRVQGIPADAKPGDVAAVSISAPAMMDEGSSAHIKAEGVTYSGELSVLPYPQWSLADAQGNNLPGCIEAGVLTPSTYGNLTLKVTAQGFSGSKNVLVNEIVKPVEFTASARQASVIVGNPVYFDVNARNQFGGVWPVSEDNLYVTVNRDGVAALERYDIPTASLTPEQPGTYQLDFTETGRNLKARATVKSVNISDANLALGCRAWASSVRDGNSAAAVTDGQTTGKRWESEWGKEGEWIAIDLGKVYDLTSVRLFWEGAFAKKFTIETSEDGEIWKQAADVTDSQGGEERVNLAPNSFGRFIRLTSKERALPAYGNSMYEFEVYGSGLHNGTVTVIENLYITSDTEGEFYDLNGVKIERPGEPGIYVVRYPDGTVAKRIYR